MATVRERICAAGVNTLREFMCLDVGVGGGITYTGEIIQVDEVSPIILQQTDTLALIGETPNVSIEQVNLLVEITELKEDNIDGLC